MTNNVTESAANVRLSKEVHTLRSAHALLTWLTNRGRLGAAVAEQIRLVELQTRDRATSILLKLGYLSESQLAASMAEFANCPTWQPEKASDLPEPVPGLNSCLLRTREIIPLKCESGITTVLCWDATDEYAFKALRFATGNEVEPCIGERSEVQRILQAVYPLQADQHSTPELDDAVLMEEMDRLTDLASDAPIIRLVQKLFETGVQARASDIHLEPSEEGLIVRQRLDGLLRVVAKYPKTYTAPVISRIKVLASLDIAERRLPQDGRIRVTVQGKEIDFRVATSPVLLGESLVLRILDRQDVKLDLTELGFDDQLALILRNAIARPHGIVVVTGPTGSGKTTTLYAALKELNSPHRKILTVEDPVEYMLEGVNQVPIRPQIGLTFAQALRSFLRQDPDVLMVGEIRDRETAETAIQAALTGHMLLSTLHTNSAGAAITRLLDMGIDDFLLTSTLHLIIGQRLVRKLCEACREAHVPDARLLLRCGLTSEPQQPWYRPNGCGACQGTGYRGRTTLVEALQMSDAVRSAVLRRADAHEIERIAIAEGMRTLVGHGVQRVSQGETSIDEVLRVTSLH